MQVARTIKRFSAVLAALCSLAACEMEQLVNGTQEAQPENGQAPVAKPTSQESAALRSYLAQIQTAQLRQGLLRRDGGGPDTPYTADMLARNFEQIVFYNEYASALQGRGGQSPLRRWERPVRIKTLYGAGVPPSLRKSDEAAVRNYVRRLGRVARHPIGTGNPANFIVIFAGEDDRDAALDAAAELLPGISAKSLDPLRKLDRDTYCVVAAYASGSKANTYTAAVAVIRAENPDLLRLSCIHEELAQGLGLANDSRNARPSIFNDDDEFALLTSHDEKLLQMLYDSRLKPGMSAAEAAPITRTIARELITSGPL